MIKLTGSNQYKNKCDPVKKYHEYKRCWVEFPIPGEERRNQLRWGIRERMHQVDPVLSKVCGDCGSGPYLALITALLDNCCLILKCLLRWKWLKIDFSHLEEKNNNCRHYESYHNCMLLN